VCGAVWDDVAALGDGMRVCACPLFVCML
jgi:hypothetical protein